MNLINVVKNINKSVKEKGINKTIKELFFYVHSTKEINKHAIYSNNIKKDILFVNGCDLLHPKRYRVDNQIEQLEYCGITCDQEYYLNIKIKQIYEYNAFVLFRCPITPLLERFINEANQNNKMVIFDVDDLIIDEKYVRNVDVSNKKEYLDGVDRIKQTLSMCDIATTSTTVLANELKHYVKNVYINRNIASKELIEISEKENRKEVKKDDYVTLGYFSGSITHNPDFEMILSVLMQIMDKYEDVRLMLVGDIDIPESLSKYKDKLIIKPFVDYRKLPGLIKQVDINLIPLVDNLFNEAKSEIKWLEASLVKVVSVSSNIGSLKEMIIDNKTGILCSSKQEWFENLSYLIENEQARIKLANSAYDYCLKNCSFKNINNELPKMLKKIKLMEQ